MRVEPIGDLFAEPKSGDTYFQPSRTTEPITILNQNANYLSGKENIFSELNQEESIVIIGRKDLNSSFENEHHILPSGFFLTEEEWLLFKQPHLGLEPYEQKKMGSLPKSFTPLSLTSVGGGLERRALSNGSASDSIWLRKCESLTATPSLPCNEPNNNTLSHPPSLNKLFSQQSQSKDIVQEEDEKENWLGNVSTGEEKRQRFGTQKNVANDINNRNLPSGPELQVLTNEPNNNQNSVSVHGMVMNDQGMDLIRDLATGTITDHGYQPCLKSSVGTIGSHPQPITCSSHDQIHTPSHSHCPPTKVAKQSGDAYFASSFGFGPNQDWQPPSLEWSDPTNMDQCSWNKNVAAGNTTDAIPYHSIDFPYAEKTTAGNDEMDTLLTFLSKFDDKVAAIWDEEGAVAGISSNLSNVAGHSSTSSTPIGNSNPWGSPTSDDSTAQGYYDYRAMQIKIEQQQHSLVESQLAADRFSQRHLSGHSGHRKEYPQQLKPNPSNRIAIGTSRISPPKGKYTIMHSMKQHFGTAPSEEEYHIVRKTDTGSSEEKEKSLEILNHIGDRSGFVTFLPEIQSKPEITEVLHKPAAVQPSEIDISNMQYVLNGLDLEFEEELEIMAACKGDPKPFIEQASQEDLLNSWKTHFTTVEVLETSDIYGPMASPVTTLSAHQINPNLPEYRLFDGDEEDYSFFKRPGRTMFPVRYKLRWENEKAVQTEDFGDTCYDMQQEPSYCLSALDWESYVPGHSDPFSSSSRSRTPVDTRSVFDYDYDTGLEIQTSDWFADGNGVGSGSLAEFEYNGSLDSGGVGGGTHVYLQTDYCCDSGIGIDGSSRAEFYDDVFPDYEGDYEYVGGGLDDAGISLQGYSTTNDNDVDYGHFQGVSCHPGSTLSSVSGKQGKGNRRRAKVKPCKYFFLDGSCRRGKDCKFSHDLTTCRYWAEGSCLKGESCPYLHCFLERRDSGHAEFKNIGRNNYHLESENDFPALGGTKRNSMISSRVPMSDGFPPSSICEGGSVGDSSESLLMLADQASSIYAGFGDYPLKTSETRGYGKRKNEAVGSNIRKNVAEEQWWLPEGNDNYKGKARIFGESGTGTSIPWSRHGTNKGNGHNSNSWISSMISVKEKRKKKKH